MGKKFWEKIPLDQLDRKQWELLCDGCAKCCLLKLEDEETGIIYSTNVVCQYLDLETCQCCSYSKRSELVPECVTLQPDNLDQVYFMPTTCAYRLLTEGQPLPDWHPLCGDNNLSVHQRGYSVQGKVISELEADDLTLHLTGEWE